MSIPPHRNVCTYVFTRPDPQTYRRAHLGPQPPDEEVETVDVAEADERHDALAGEQRVEQGPGLAELEILCFSLCVWYQCVCMYISTEINDGHACVMMSAPAIPNPTRSSPISIVCALQMSDVLHKYAYILHRPPNKDRRGDA